MYCVPKNLLRLSRELMDNISFAYLIELTLVWLLLFIMFISSLHEEKQTLVKTQKVHDLFFFLIQNEK